MSQSYPQQGVGGMDSRYVRRDGSVGLTGDWVSTYRITTNNFRATSGGNFSLGEIVGALRISRIDNETIQIVGASNNFGVLNLKNLRVGDLSGVGNRNVIADVNGDLSAP